MFIVHGIGSVCDIRFRSIVECGKCLLSNRAAYGKKDKLYVAELYLFEFLLNVHDKRLRLCPGQSVILNTLFLDRLNY